jgi:hypothetical protein
MDYLYYIKKIFEEKNIKYYRITIIVLYFLLFSGIISANFIYYNPINILMQVLICIVLIIYLHPFSAKYGSQKKPFEFLFENRYYNYIETITEIVKKPLFIGSLLLLKIVYILVFLGVIHYQGNFITYINNFVQILICGVLIIRFNPFRKHTEIKEFDNEIIFTAALFLLANMGVEQILITNFDKTRDIIRDNIRTTMNMLPFNKN